MFQKRSRKTRNVAPNISCMASRHMHCKNVALHPKASAFVFGPCINCIKGVLIGKVFYSRVPYHLRTSSSITIATCDVICACKCNVISRYCSENFQCWRGNKCNNTIEKMKSLWLRLPFFWLWSSKRARPMTADSWCKNISTPTVIDESGKIKTRKTARTVYKWFPSFSLSITW